jgi:hypothetical protein
MEPAGGGAVLTAMRQRVGLLLFSLLALPSARADQVSGTRGAVLERRHQVEVVLYPGHARLTVRRTVENLGPRHDQAVFELELPEEMTATGLRTLGLVDGRPHWFPGELMEAEAAAHKYQKLTGVGGAYPKDPALLSWRNPGLLWLQVFPVPPAESKTVEYTLTAPTAYENGRHRLVLPQLGTPELAPRVVVKAANGEALFVDGRPFPSGAAVDWSWATATVREKDEEDEEDDELTEHFTPAGGLSLELALAPRHAPLLDGRLAVKGTGAGRSLVRYRVEAAPRLSEIPRHAQLVVILDASRSQDGEDRAAALAAARAYLGHFEAAEVQVLTFARKAQAEFPRFLPVAQAIERLAALTVRPANGSHFDAALALADRLLVARPSGARRVLLLTDLLTREALTPARQRQALAASGALLHIGVVTPGQAHLAVRADDWSVVARGTGGLVWDAEAQLDDDRSMRRVFEEWARPVRLHAFTIARPAPEEGEGEEADRPPETLDEGAGTTFIGLTRAAATSVEVRGELWSRPVRLSLRPDAAETRLWSALVFGTGVRDDLSEPEMMVLARHGRAVSPVTSYLAIEPGVRPSTEGLEEGVGSLGMIGTGFAAGGSVGCDAAVPPFDHQAWLQAAVTGAWRTCAGRGGVRVTLETTRAEIVEVDARGSTQAAALTCLREAIWALELPEAFRVPWERWSVNL